jgi:hypothetical protein
VQLAQLILSEPRTSLVDVFRAWKRRNHNIYFNMLSEERSAVD